MNAATINNRKEKIKKAGHITAGIIILLHAYERFEAGHESYIFFAIAGFVFLSIAFFHHALKSRFPMIDTFFFAIEAILSFIIAYEYFHAGKSALPYAYLFAGLMQFLGLFLFARKNQSYQSE